MALSPGTRLGSYEIVSSLGVGGMGEVYRAKDLDLGREVAIKVLREELASDPDGLKRFEREARAASTLNHPNITTIHHIGEHAGTRYIAMELVEGQTLRELLSSSRLSTMETLDIATQIARGLSKAHAAGIVHRDLKPGNLMVTEDGLVKILDFGLAKLISPGSDVDPEMATVSKATRQGTLLGTVQYMSPEQAAGRGVDYRSDQFSFGSILYEMLTGRLAFEKDTVPQTLAAIIEGTPEPIRKLNHEAPAELLAIVERCLAKAPDKRYDKTKELAAELGSVPEASSLSRGARTTVLWMAAAVLGVFLVSALALNLLKEEEHAVSEVRLIPLTSEDGIENEPAISPDGSRVAFTWDGGTGGRPQLYIKTVGGGTPTALSTEGDAYTPAWAPDGSQIAFIRHTEESGDAIVLVDPLGASERQLTLTNGYQHGLDWTPEGETLLFVDRESSEENDPDSIYLYSLETGDRRRLSSPPADSLYLRGDGDAHPALSPDGRLVAFVRRFNYQGEIFVQRLDQPEAAQLTELNGFILDVDWLPDGSGLVFTHSKHLTGTHLWTVGLDGSPPRRLTFGEDARALSVAGDRLAFVKGKEDYDVWRIGGPAAEGPRERLITSSRREQEPQFSPDGSRIAFVSARSGQDQLWACDTDGANCAQLTFLRAGGASAPRWSPDGTEIAFTGESASLNADLLLLEVAGGVPQPLTRRDGFDGLPSWSSDGGTIYFASDRSGEIEIWKMPTSGSDPERVTREGGVGALESRDDGYLYYSKTLRESTIWRVPVDGGAEELVLDKRPHQSEWDLWQGLLVYIWNDPKDGYVIEALDLDTMQIERLETLRQITGFGLSVSRDGKWIAYTQQDTTGSDLMLVDGFLAALQR